MASQSGADAGSMSLVCWSGDVDRVWPQLILATTGAAYGMDVMMFCTFWGLFTLKRPEVTVTGDDWMTRLLGAATNARLSHLNFGGLGPRMMRQITAAQNVTPPDELLGIARELGVRIAPCQMTMDLMGLTEDDLVDGLEQPLGAAAAVAHMKNADIQLFI